MSGISIQRATQNQLKTIAAISMLIDHVGLTFFPELRILRILGRLAFPIFSFFVYEGFVYTRSKSRYFRRLFMLGALCALVFYIYSGEIYGNVLITFSLSVIVLSCLQLFCESLEKGRREKVMGAAVLLGGVAIVYVVCPLLNVDYGFFGVLLPVLVMLADKLSATAKGRRYIVLAAFAVGLLALSAALGEVQIYGLLSVPLLALYNGRRGTLNMKSFFYWFYPGHLLLIGAAAFLLQSA